MRKVTIGDLVETIHGVDGILIAVVDSRWGPMAIIATADFRDFHCPITEFKNCEYYEE